MRLKRKIDLDDIQNALENYLENHPEIDMIKIEVGRKDEKFEVLGIHGPGIYIDTTVRPTSKNRLTKLVPNVIRPNVAKINYIKF